MSPKVYKGLTAPPIKEEAAMTGKSKNSLYQTAIEYVKVIEQIEQTGNPKKLQLLEEKRVELHWKFMDLLKRKASNLKIETTQPGLL